jgi:peptide/nickel transport system substrate-binding protein
MSHYLTRRSLARRVTAASLCFLAFAAPAAAQDIESYGGPALESQPALTEVAYFEDAVATGDLPRVEERVPLSPLVVEPNENQALGRQGGDITMLVGRAKDVRLLVVYGYARLVRYDENFDIQADILQSVEVENGRRFTMKLRPGHRWSDGAPFTSEDFRFFWEDVANNPEVSQSGPPRELLVEGRPPTVTFPDETTVIYEWHRPNPFFLPAIAGATPLFIYRPAHYLKQFHIDYAEDPEALEEAAEEAGYASWVSLQLRNGNLYKFSIPEVPTLQPWRNVSEDGDNRFQGERNPFFHRIDTAGVQLPYLDNFYLNTAQGALIPAKTATGEPDLQSRGLNFSDYTFLKENEDRSDYDVRLWKTIRGSQLALYPNLNIQDPMWAELIRDVRFRRALSLAINRHEINQVVYFGLGLEGNQSVLPKSPLATEDYRQRYANFDIDEANRLLDDVGLTERDSRGVRLLPNGEPLQIVVETAGENTEESDVLELIRDSWEQIGVKLFTKPSQREVLRNRVFAGETVIAMWYGYENAMLTADMAPEEFVPVTQQSLQWPMWGQYYETSGQSGEAPDTPEAMELMQLWDDWRSAESRAERRLIWERILEINADQVYTIGLVAQIPQPIVVSKELENVPVEGVYNWSPGAQFGVYQPPMFWLNERSEETAELSD